MITETIDEATKRLLAAVARLSDEELRAPSLLEGWSRGHVITHIARSGDAMNRMLVWARTGEGVPGYPSHEARDADIEAGAGRSASVLLVDLADSAAGFTTAARVMGKDEWKVDITTPTGVRFPAHEVPIRRLAELELHHTDLDIGYGPADWTPGFAEADLPEPLQTWRADRIAWTQK